MVDGKESQSGAEVSIVETDEGRYKVTQVDTLDGPSKPGDGIDINYSFGPIKMVGYVVKSTLQMGIEVSVAGITIGTFHGNIKDGLGADFKLQSAVGVVRFYLRNGNEAWVHLECHIVFNGSYDKDSKLVTM